MSAPVRPELGRAWERYFGRRGGETPKPAPEVLAVVQFDDMAAYPPFRRFYAGRRNAAATPLNTHAIHAIYNDDPVGTGSVVVVEDIVCGFTSWISIIDVAHLNALVALIVEDREAAADAAQEKEQNLVQPSISNVKLFIGSATELPAQAIAFFVDGRQRGPWTLNPQTALVVGSDQTAVQVLTHWRGRYYPRP